MKADNPLSPNLQLARTMLVQNGLSFVIVKDGGVLSTSKGKGVRPFYDVVTNLEQTLNGAAVADQVIGKAVAMLCVHSGIESVYARMISEPAVKSLKEASIPVISDQTVPVILNRDGTDWCPFEKLTRNLDTPVEVFNAIKSFFGG